MFALVVIAMAAQSPGLSYSRPELLASLRSAVPGKAFLVGIRFKQKHGWHIYWHNPGDSGQEVRVKWKLPVGWKVGPLMWPKPQVLAVDDIVDYVYDGEVTLLAKVTPSRSAGPLRADLDWLVCDAERCVPAKTSITTAVSLGKHERIAPRANSALEAARMVLPRPLPGVASASLEGKTIRLTVSAPQTSNSDKFGFLPFDTAVVANSASQKFQIQGSHIVFTLDKSPYFNPKTDRLRGIFFDRSSRIFNEIDVPLERAKGEQP